MCLPVLGPRVLATVQYSTRAVLDELKERRGTPAANGGELYRPYGEDVHNFWLHQTLVRSGAD